MPETKVVLNLQTKGNAARETKDIARNMSKAARAADEFRAKMDARGGGAKAGQANATGGIGGLGRLGLASMGLGAVQQVAGQFSRMAGVMQNSLLFEEQRTRKLAESIPVIGGLASSLNTFTDELSGAADRMRRASMAHQVAMANIAAKQEAFAETTQRGFGPGRASAKAAAGLLAPSVRRIMAEAPDANNVRAFARFEGMLPSRIRGEELDLEHRGAVNFGGQLDRQIRETEGRRNRLQAEATRARAMIGRAGELSDRSRQQAQARLNPLARGMGAIDNTLSNLGIGGSRPGEIRGARLALTNTALQKQKQLEQEIANLKTLQNEKQQNAVRIAELESQKRKNLVDQQRSQLSILREQEQLQRGQAGSFGNLTSGQREIAFRFAQQAKTQGFDSLVPAQRDLLRQAGFGEFVQRGLERKGEADPRLRQIRELIGQEGPSTLAETLRQKVKLQSEIQVNLAVDSDELANTLADRLGKLFKEIVVTIEQQTAQRIHNVELQQLQARNSP